MLALRAAANDFPYRPVEGRISAGDDYRAAKQPGRSARLDALPSAFSKVLARLSERPPDDAETQHARGLAQLYMGNTETAVMALEKAMLLSTRESEIIDAVRVAREPQLLSDLASAYLGRGSDNEVPDAFLANECAARAWRLEQTPAIAWNRALALQTVNARAQALEAWNDYLRLDDRSGWASEAIIRIRQLSTPSQSRRWIAIKASLPSTSSNLAASVRAFPQESRTFAEEELLAEWSRESQPGNAEPEKALLAARAIGDSLKRYAGEWLLADSVAAIDRARGNAVARQQFVDAHRAYSEGRELFSRQQMTAAVSRLHEAEERLSAAGTPFAYRAALYASTAEYYTGELERSESHLRRMLRTLALNDTRYPSLIGQIHWVIGLIEYSRGRKNQALDAYHAAHDAFSRTGERENLAGIESLLAETYRTIGQDRLGWTFQRRALRSLDGLGSTRRSHAILTDAAIASAADGLPLSALMFQTDLVAIARASNDPVSICDALIGRSTYASAAGETELARADLAEARQRLREVTDRGMSNRTLGNLLAAETAMLRMSDPQRAVVAAESAIAQMTALGHRTRLVQLELERGRALSRLSRNDGALRAWDNGIAECERQRSALRVEFRQTYLDQCRSLFDESIGLLARERKFADAAALTEKVRARGLFDALARTSGAGANRYVPAETTILEYFSLPDALVVWTIDSAGVRGVLRPTTRRTMGRIVDRLLTADVAKFESASAATYDVLIRPVEGQLSPRIVVVPDGDVFRVPFAALYDLRTRRYLVERHEISIAPSVSVLQRLEAHADRDGRRALLIDAGATGNPIRDERLAGASREIRDLSALYGNNAAVISGEACTKDNFLRSLRTAAMVHFSGHASAQKTLAAPALVVRASGHDDGLIYPRDIAALTLSDTKLVVLGACDTATGRIGSEGPASIARAFLAAGAQRVVATLWPVDDASSAALLTRFHKTLLAGVTAPTALRATQIAAIRQSIPARDWAAFEVLQTEY